MHVSKRAAAIVAATVLGTTGALAAAQMALAHNDSQRLASGTATDPTGGATYLAAVLDGRNEVPVAGGPAVGDPDGQAIEVLRVKGSQVSFAIKWRNLGPITAGHVHAGAPGVNGPVQVPFFGAGLSDPSLQATVGSVTVSDTALLTNLTTNPGSFYANLHTAEFPGGAVRGQLHKLSHAVDLNAVLRGGPLAAILSGDQEVPAAAPVGDPDGHASAFVGTHGGTLEYTFTWSGIGAPTNGHIHQGTVGVNGPVVAPLFAAPTGLPTSVTGVAGSVPGLAPELLRRIASNPNGFYANLHTAEFSGGAVRGQLFPTAGTGQQQTDAFDQSAFVAPVVRGEQIYQCTRQTDGTYAFTQHNVAAILQHGIAHSFVKDNAGPPQWVARDGSAVTGKVLAKTANGTGNIAELDLDATRAGTPTGLLADTVEILRLNTIGGLAPAGGCTPGALAKVPYQADYLFIGQ